MSDDEEPTKDDARGSFFAVETAAWAKVCDRGSMNEAVAYLTLARGAHFATRKSSWSVEAIETRTSISRLRAKSALQDLVKSGLLQQLRGGTRPQYYLPTADAIEKQPKPSVELSETELAILDKIAEAGEPIAPPVRGTPANGWPKGSLQGLADGLVRKGWLVRLSYKFAIAPTISAEPPKPEWTWLPNSLVDGVDDVTAPIEQIRQTQSLPALRLFVDLYFAQSLAFNGGVHWRQARKEFSKELIGRSGLYDVWGFRATRNVAWTTTPFVSVHLTGEKEPVAGTDRVQDTGLAVFWDALGKLEQLGLVRFVGHVIDADTDEGEVVHPFGIGVGEDIEKRIAKAAHQAAFRLLNESKTNTARERGLVLIPLARHRSNAELVGLIRTTHRAHTSATADWLSNADSWLKWAETYEQIGSDILSDQDAR